MCEREHRYEVLCPDPDPRTTIGELTVVTAHPRRSWWRKWGLAVREQVGYLDALVRSRAC